MSNVRSRLEALFSGSGPGTQTADGCSVELFRRLPYLGELEGADELFTPGARVLDLGCGAGRLTQRMLEWDAAVTAVDNSAEMLAAAPSGARKLLCDIQQLELNERFSIVLLASCLINHPVAAVREGFLRVARDHLISGGHVLVERHNPDWLAGAKVGPHGSFGGVALFVESFQSTEERVKITLRYTFEAQVWRQSFEAVVLQKPEVEDMLSSCGFHSHIWFGSNERWVKSRAA